MRSTKIPFLLAALSVGVLLTGCGPDGPLAPQPPKLQCKIPADLKKIEPLPEFPEGPVNVKVALKLADKLHAVATNAQVLHYQVISYAEERCELSTASKPSAAGVNQAGR